MAKNFNITLQTNILFGEGRIREIGEIAAAYGKKAMLVTCRWPEVQKNSFHEIIKIIECAGVEVILYDKATPNPTVDSIEEAADIARQEQVSIVIGLGGGSAMDTAKGVSLCYAHEGGIWQYTYVSDIQLPIYADKLLPVIAVTTTSGTGSQVTPYCVLQDPKRKIKTCVAANNAMIPRVAIVDPELMVTMPPHITAATGFDVFAHAFEAYTYENSNPFIEVLALKTIALAVQNLKSACSDGNNLEIRGNMAFADTMAGLCISMNNTTMPHDIGQAIVGKSPNIPHGISVAMVYPEYIAYALSGCIQKFAKIARIFNNGLCEESDQIAAAELKEQVISWEKAIGVYTSGNALGFSEEVKTEVIEETVRNCPFITDICKLTRGEIAELIERIWTQ